jgi:hypothetical protein
VDRDRREVLGLHQCHHERVPRASGVTEQVHALLVDIELHRQHLYQVVQEVGSVLGHTPTLWCERIRRGEDDAFLFRERRPWIEK